MCNGPAGSIICSNVLYCCQKYNINIHDLTDDAFINGISKKIFILCGKPAVSGDLVNTLLEIIFIRDGIFNFNSFLNRQQLQDIIIELCTV